MLDDTAELLGSSWEEARYIGKSHDWNLKSIAETDESSCLNTDINVKTPCKTLRLVSNNSYGTSFNFCKASNYVFGEGWHNLVKLITIAYSFDDSEYMIWFVGVIWNYVVEN